MSFKISIAKTLLYILQVTDVVLPSRTSPIPLEDQFFWPAEEHGVKMEQLSPPHDNHPVADPNQGNSSLTPTVEPACASGLSLLRTNIAHSLATVTMQLRAATHDQLTLLTNLRRRLKDEQNHLKFLSRKCAEKEENHARVFREWERARDLGLATNKPGNCTSLEEIAARKTLQTMYESLEESWLKNVEIAEHRRSAWIFKVKRQTDVVNKATAQLASAEENYTKKETDLHAKEKDLQAVSKFLSLL